MGAVGPAHELRRHVVGGREDEDEQERGHGRGGHQRQDHAPPARERVRPEVLRSLDERGRDRAEARVENEDHVRQEDVHERHRDGELVVEQEAERLVDHPRRFEARVEQPVAAEDRAPGVDAHEVAGEERRGDQEEDEHLPAAGGEAQPVGDRERDQHRRRRGQQADDERVDGERAVDIGRQARR